MSSDASSPVPASGPVPSAAQWLPGLFDPAAPGLLVPWVEQVYIPLKVALGRRAKTGAATLVDIRLFDRFCRETLGRPATFADLSLLRANQFLIWHRSQKRVKSGATPNRTRGTLRAVWREAAKQQPPLCPPPCELPLAKVDKPLPRAWSADEVGRIAYTARSADWHWYRPRGKNAAKDWRPPAIDAGLWFFAVVMTAYYTGARINAILTTPCVRLDLTAARLSIPADAQKHRAEQDFDLPVEVVQAWRQLDPIGRRLVRLGDDWPYDRGPSGNWQCLGNWLKKLLRESGVVLDDHADFRRDLWHKFRRTCATHLAAREGIEKAQRFLGHKSLSTTLRYIDQRFMPRTNVVDILPRPTPPPKDVLPFRVIDAS